jgi:hypothetical protein
MKTIKILAIVKTGTTETLMRVPQITVREDGTLWANNNTMPLTNSSGTLNKDSLLPLMTAKAWDKIPSDNFLRLGVNPGDKEAMDDADLSKRYTDNRTQEEKAAQAAAAAERAKKAREWDRINNEGGEGYNPYRDQAEMVDNTPWMKGDDQAE